LRRERSHSGVPYLVGSRKGQLQMKFALPLAIFIATNAAGAPSVSLHWSDCASTVSDRTLADGASARIVVTASGLSGVVRATDVRVNVIHRGYAGLPDFWRFDPAGCAAGKMTAVVGGAGDCPSLGEPAATLGYFSSGEAAPGGAVLAAAFDPVQADPNATYTLATFTFDFSSPNCACPDQALCFHLSASWLDGNGGEYFFDAGPDLTWNDPYGTSCGGPPLCGNPDDCVDPPNPCALGPTPARAQTWGRVKASYR